MDEKKRFQFTEAIGVITRSVETDNDFVWYGITSIGRFISPNLRCPGNTDSLETHCDSDKLQPGDVVHVMLEVMPKWVVHKCPFVTITCRPTSVPSIRTYFIGGSDKFDEKRLIIRCKIDFMSYDEEYETNCYKCEVVDRVYDTRSIVDKSRGSCLAEVAANCLTNNIPRYYFVFAVIKYLDDRPPATDSSSGSPTALSSGDLQLTDEHYDRKETIGMITGASNLIRFGISPVGLFVMNTSTHMQHRKNPVIGDIVEVVLRETPKRFAYADKHPFVALSCRIVPTPPSLQISLRKNAYGEQLFVRCMISRLDYEVLDSDDDFYKCEIYERVRDPYRRVDETRCPCMADLKMQRVDGRWTLAVYAVVNCLQQTTLPSSFDDEIPKADEPRRTIGIITRTYDHLRFGFSPLGPFSILFETIMEEPEHSRDLCVGDVVELLLGETPASQREAAKDRLKALTCRRVPAPPSVEIYFREGVANGYLTVRCKITYSGYDEASNFNVYDSELCGKVHDIRRIVDQRTGACIADLTPRRLFGKETVVFSVQSVLEYCEAATPGGHYEPAAPASLLGERLQQIHSEVEKGDKTAHPSQSPTNEFVDSGVSITGSSRISEEIRESSNDQSWESLLRRVIKDRNVRGVLRTEHPDLYDEVMDRLMD